MGFLRTPTAVLTLLCVLITGCSTQPYVYGTGRGDKDTDLYPPMEQQIYIGAPSPVLDAADWYWPPSLLSKLLLWNINIDSHDISDETLDVMKKYVADNELHDVQILVNTYKPGNQWRRLFKNRTMNPFWRYTLGIISVSFYTILPGRFFGGDNFNPYTNTLNLFSDDPSIALHEAGHAKDFASRELKGAYSAIYALPFVALYHEAVATSDALSYLLDQNCSEERKDAYNLLYPAYSTYVGGNIATFTSPVLQYAGIIPGHIAGRVASAGVDDAEEPCGLYLANKDMMATPVNGQGATAAVQPVVDPGGRDLEAEKAAEEVSGR